jgi:hypothetical protein
MLALLHILTIIMPRERGKLKRGPTYYDFIARRTNPAPLLILSQLPALHDVTSPSTTQNWDAFDNDPVLVEEEIPLTQLQSMDVPTVVSPVQTQEPLRPPTQKVENSPTLQQGEYSDCPVLEEIPQVPIEEGTPDNMDMNTMVSQFEDTVPEMPCNKVSLQSI